MSNPDSTVRRPKPSESTPETGAEADKGNQPQRQGEVGGPPGPEPTRYGDWEKGGRCIDF